MAGKRVSRRAKVSTDTLKPYPEFPLTAHPTGRWCKKRKGETHYFGPIDDWEAALEKYEKEWPYIYAGKPIPENPDGLTVGRLCAKFLESKERKRDAGELAQRTFDEYASVAVTIEDALGVRTLVESLTADDFGQLRAQLAKRLGPTRLAHQIGCIRSVFKFGYDAGIIEKPMRFGPEFVKPSLKTVRIYRASKTPQMFTPAEIQAMLKKASVPVKAMILLAINAGFGNTDIGELNRSFVDLKAGVIDYPRPKTGVPRRCVLWKETIKALQAALSERREPKDEADADAVFVTKFGQRWCRGKGKDAVAQEFEKARVSAGVPNGRGFYALRHTFLTVAENGVRDDAAIDLVMGHAGKGSIRDGYRENIDDKRLRAVANHVRRWLQSSKKKAKRSATK